MRDTHQPAGPSEDSMSHADHHMPVPDTSMLPGSELPPPAAVNLLNHAVRGAHHTLDRLNDRAQPLARQLGARVESAGDALRARADRVRHVRDDWASSARGTVRRDPLLSVVVAAVAGALLAHLLRRSGGRSRTR